MYLPTLDEAHHSIELITAFYTSARSGGIVRLPLADDHDAREFELLLKPAV
jgi:hypothetical protein